ncbi:MAG: rRNA maturation RNase YbeY [Neisseriaceae bacterium]
MINIFLHKQVKRLYQPKRKNCLFWIQKSLIKEYNLVSIDILIVSKEQSLQLNSKYRNRNSPTNVISLEYNESRDKYNMLCGELILCDGIIVDEAIDQNKDIMLHYAHMIIHGVLHLQGLDHQNDEDANYMEQLEIDIMQQCGFVNPYINYA